MREIGIFLFLAGLVAIVMPFVAPTNFRFPLLDWMNNWGTTAGWAIRGGITLLGLVIWLSFKNRDRA